MEPKIILCECGKVFRPLAYEIEDSFCEWERGEECTQEGHRKIVLTILSDSFISDKPFTEVVKTSYFYASDQNGKKWVVKKWRENSEEPCRYEVFEGRIDCQIVSLAVQRDAIARQLQAEAIKAGIVVNDDYVNLIVARLNNQISYDCHLRWLTPNQIIISDEHPLMITVPLPSWMAESLCKFCQQFFPEKHRRFIKDFIEREKEEDDVLAFVGRRKFEVIHY